MTLDEAVKLLVLGLGVTGAAGATWLVSARNRLGVKKAEGEGNWIDSVQANEKAYRTALDAERERRQKAEVLLVSQDAKMAILTEKLDRMTKSRDRMRELILQFNPEMRPWVMTEPNDLKEPPTFKERDDG